MGTVHSEERQARQMQDSPDQRTLCERHRSDAEFTPDKPNPCRTRSYRPRPH